MYTKDKLLAHRETELGMIRSNTFKVKDVEAFTEWFRQYHFGYRVTVQTETETRLVCSGATNRNLRPIRGRFSRATCSTTHHQGGPCRLRPRVRHLEPGEAVSIVAVESSL